MSMDTYFRYKSQVAVGCRDLRPENADLQVFGILARRRSAVRLFGSARAKTWASRNREH